MLDSRAGLCFRHMKRFPQDLASTSCSDLDSVAVGSDGFAYIGLLELHKSAQCPKLCLTCGRDSRLEFFLLCLTGGQKDK